MTLQTTPADRREMVQAISERLNSPAVYLRTPTYAYRIGGLTVERDGSIDSDDEALLETLRPMLIERGWLTDAAAADSEAAADQESGEGAVVNAESEATAADYASAAKDSESTDMELSFPVEDWTVAQLNNLLRTLYAVYSTTTTEASHQDDMVTSYRTFVYLNLWSDIDPTETANRIRAAMYDAGFFMVEESDKGYNQPAYDTATTQYTVQWTWCLRTEVKPNAP